MTRCAKNHPDCCADCPSDESAVAHYAEPYGPCNTSCDPADAGRFAVAAAERHGFLTLTSGTAAGRVDELASGFLTDGRPDRLFRVAPEVERPRLDMLFHALSRATEDRRQLTMSWQLLDAADVMWRLLRSRDQLP